MPLNEDTDQKTIPICRYLYTSRSEDAAEIFRGARRSVSGTADRADHLSGFDDPAFMHTFAKPFR